MLRAGEVCRYALPTWGPGTCSELVAVRIPGTGKCSKVYIQAGLHADEAPGYLVADRLVGLLDEAAVEGRLRAEGIVVPVANPIGLTQWSMETIQGRFDLSDNVNFNRDFPELFESLAAHIEGKLTDDPDANVRLIRRASATILAEWQAVTPAAVMKLQLLRLSHDADIVLDLHCDFEAAFHVYMGTPHWPAWSDLSAHLGARATLLAMESGGNPFDEANSRLWWQLADRFPDHPIPPACMAATVELRGERDTGLEQAAKDAAHIYAFLQRRGFVGGDPPPLPPLIADASPLAGVEYITAGDAGILSYCKEVGDRVMKNETLAILTSPTGCLRGERPIEIVSGIDGIFFARSLDRFARPGKVVAKVAGLHALAGKGTNLLTI